MKKDSEAALQSAVIRYIKLKHPNIRYCASLGGIYNKSKAQNRKVPATGYVAGVPDLQIMEARGGYFGLFIELKLNKTRYPTPAQIGWLMDLNTRGYYAVCSKGFDETIKAIDDYLSEQATRTLHEAAAK